MSSPPSTEISLTSLSSPSPKTLLNHYLSLTSYLTASASSSIVQEYPLTSSPGPYISIGHGQCAEIFHQPPFVALKKAHPPQEKHAEVHNDSICHQAVISAFEKYAKSCHIPAYHSLILPDNDDWYKSHGQLIPHSKLNIAKGSRERTPILAMERIPPLPSPIRSALISQFCPPHLQDTAREDEENRDCLLRIYLGARLPCMSSTQPFSLRNFPLCLDKIGELGLQGLEAGEYAEVIAEGLAILHWGAGVDGRDVEFLLGSPRMEVEGRGKREAVWVWVLDFNQCECIGKDERGVEMAARAWWDNDPYFPRPGGTL